MEPLIIQQLPQGGVVLCLLDLHMPKVVRDEQLGPTLYGAPPPPVQDGQQDGLSAPSTQPKCNVGAAVHHRSCGVSNPGVSRRFRATTVVDCVLRAHAAYGTRRPRYMQRNHFRATPFPCATRFRPADFAVPVKAVEARSPRLNLPHDPPQHGASTLATASRSGGADASVPTRQRSRPIQLPARRDRTRCGVRHWPPTRRCTALIATIECSLALPCAERDRRQTALRLLVRQIGGKALHSATHDK